MAEGYLEVRTTTNDELAPIKGTRIIIRDPDGVILSETVTDASGNTGEAVLSAPPKENTLDPKYGTSAYNTYNIEASASGFTPVRVNGVQIVDGAHSLLPIIMHPVPDGQSTDDGEVKYIDPPTAALVTRPQMQDENTPFFNSVNDTRMVPEYSSPQSGGRRAVRRPLSNPRTDIPLTRLTEPVCLPDYIRVHLGAPQDSSARNVRVKFDDYVKNVTNSEIYSSWPAESIIANVHAIVSFALNRIYTEWYPSRGYSFDITNNTGYDQKYTPGRNIDKNIIQTVDEYLNTFARRQGFANPYFTEYCNGTTATCNGMSQWGTEYLARQGYSPLEILLYYYPDDLRLVATDCVRGVTASSPGTALRVGSRGGDVTRIQNFLTRIKGDYPAIPAITDPDGSFGSSTAAAVRKFQEIFSLTADGIVGRATWNKITAIYTGITKLSELNGEGQRIGLSDSPPENTVSAGARGEDVAHIQFLLELISEYYSSIPAVPRDSVFGASTKNSVIAFQRRFGLVPDGVVGPATWRELYSVYKGIQNNASIPENPATPPWEGGVPVYPGAPLRQGSRGNDVKTMQTYLNEIHLSYPQIPAVSPDGIFGPATRAATVAFQQEFALTPDGIIGPATWNEIVRQHHLAAGGVPITPPSNPPGSAAPEYPGVLISFGSAGESVRQIQQRLGINPDGIFGGQTYNAVVNFQRQRGLTPDGIVGRRTWDALFG